MANEHSNIDWLTEKLREQNYYVWKIRDSYTNGIPDMWIQKDAGDLWLEAKYIASLPVRSSTLVVPNLSDLQRLWVTEKYNAGISCAVILFVDKECLFLTTPDEWSTGITSGEAKTRIVPRIKAVEWVQERIQEVQNGRKDSPYLDQRRPTSMSKSEPCMAS